MKSRDLKIIRAVLFECKTEKSEQTGKEEKVIDIIGKVFNLEKVGGNLLALASVLELNIKKKLMGKESYDLSKTEIKNSLVEGIFEGISKRGRAITTIILDIKKKEGILNDILNSSSDEEFRKNSAKLANTYCSLKKNPKGIIGFAQFAFKISGRFENFIAILTTEFSKSIIAPDIKSALIYLEKAFDQNFKTTILYPHLIPPPKGRPDKELSISYTQVKVHKKYSDPEIFQAAEINEPSDPQKLFEKLYEEKRFEIKELNEIRNFIDSKDLKKVFLTIKIGTNIKIRIDLKTFLDKVELIVENSGHGIFFEDEIIEVFIGKNNLLSEKKIKFKDLKELLDELSSKK